MKCGLWETGGRSWHSSCPLHLDRTRRKKETHVRPSICRYSPYRMRLQCCSWLSEPPPAQTSSGWTQDIIAPRAPSGAEHGVGLCLMWVLRRESKSSDWETQGFLLPHPSDGGCCSPFPWSTQQRGRAPAPGRKSRHQVYTQVHAGPHEQSGGLRWHPSNHPRRSREQSTRAPRPQPSPPAAQG